MPDTFGYDPNGNKTFAPNLYDQWGVYMGNRGPMIQGAPTQAAQGFGWGSDLPMEEWIANYAKGQLARGSGSLPGVTAAQGTQEYRDQVAKQHEAADWITGWGGTVGNMGIRPAKGAGLNIWNEYANHKAGELSAQMRAQALRAYNGRAAMAARSGQGPAMAPTGGTGFGTSSGNGDFGAAAPAPAAPQGITTSTPAGMQAPSLSSPTFGAPGEEVDAFGRPKRSLGMNLKGLAGG